MERVIRRPRLRDLLTLRALLFALLGVLALSVGALLLALITTEPARTPPPQREARPAAPAGTDQASLLSEDAVPDAPARDRSPLVRLPPRPAPARLQTLDALPINMINDPNLRSFLREADRVIAALDPATGYLGMLATQALRDETSRLRVVVESGGSAAALAEVRPVRSTSELPADAQTLALLLRSILMTGTGSQLGLLNSLAGQPAITERIQQAREARALGRFIEVNDALEFGADLRDHIVVSTAIDRP
ncbi:MAG: hypothetical protein OXG64_10260 [Chloroflexi bacterium]|nr:hypothetical protein [Chloroflexota bacterium]